MRDLSVYARYTWLLLQQAWTGEPLGTADLAPHYPAGHEALIQAALLQLAEAGKVRLLTSGHVLLPTEPPNRVPTGTLDIAQEFGQWWAAYPGYRKIKRAKCFEKFKRWREKGVAFEAFMAGLARWKVCKDWLKQDGEFICAPEVWLNGQCWDDHPSAADSPSSEAAPAPLVLDQAFQAQPWLGTWLAHCKSDPAKPKFHEVCNFAAALGLGAESEQAGWILKSQGPVAAAQWAWERRAQ